MTVVKFPRGRVEIVPLEVWIETIQRGPREITAAIFWQLVEEDIFDWQPMALRGVGWGWTNYPIEAHPQDAIHLVWQRGSVLRRCKIQSRRPGVCSDLRRRSWLNGG
jgi:hypothetical protein